MEENINLVYYMFNKYFKQYQYLKDDLISEGLLALCRAEKYFDETKGIKKSTYLSKAIYMAMYKYLQKEQRHDNEVSLYNSVPDSEELSFIDMIAAPDVIDDFLLHESVSQMITDQEKQILDLYSKGYSQIEIGEMFNMNRRQVMWIIKRIRKKCVKKMGGD